MGPGSVRRSRAHLAGNDMPRMKWQTGHLLVAGLATGLGPLWDCSTTRRSERPFQAPDPEESSTNARPLHQPRLIVKGPGALVNRTIGHLRAISPLVREAQRGVEGGVCRNERPNHGRETSQHPGDPVHFLLHDPSAVPAPGPAPFAVVRATSSRDSHGVDAVDTLLLKLLVTPALVGAASLAGRRWGPAVSGWIVGLPLTSGPVALFLALDHGASFAAAAAWGTLAATLSQAAFGVAYARSAGRGGWPWAFVAGCLGFAASTITLRQLAIPLVPLFLVVVVLLGVALLLMPEDSMPQPSAALEPPPWDIPARMVVTTGLVLLLTAAAPLLGPHLTGLITPFPLYAAILAIFAHQLQGPVPAIRVLRGLLLGLFAFAGFFLVLAALIERTGNAIAFVAAATVALLFQAGSLRALRRAAPKPAP